jgi:hypothetical protein
VLDNIQQVDSHLSMSGYSAKTTTRKKTEAGEEEEVVTEETPKA